MEVDSDSEESSTTTSAESEHFPLWKLVVSATPWIGIQALWSTEFAVTTPYMKDLGMTDAWSSNIWIFGPLTGFITSPVIGSLSDSCQSRLGRRRPFILGGLCLLWVASLAFASSKRLFPRPFSMWFALALFVLLDVVVNVIQTPVRAIVSDKASHEQQLFGQIVSVLFQGLGTLLGFGVMKIWEVPFEAIFQLMFVILGILTLFISIQAWVCREERYICPKDKPPRSVLTPFASAFRATIHMPPDLIKLVIVQFFSWYALFCYWPTTSTWFSVNVYGGSADAPKNSPPRIRYNEGQNANSSAGILCACLQVAFSMFLIVLLFTTRVPVRCLYALCLYVGAVALLMAKFAVGHSVFMATLIVVLIAIPVSAINALPFALVGAMNKRMQQEGKEVDTGVQMGVLNIFICAPQFFATLAVGALRERLSQAALPWVFLMAAAAFALAGTAAWAVNDRLAGSKDDESNSSGE